MSDAHAAPTIEELTLLAAALIAALRRAGQHMATAESCTGGLIGHIITEVPGASDVFAGGAIVYSNAAKQTVLGVDGATLATYGAVSAPVAAQMAQGARRLYGVDVAVSVTGIAGPGGGSPGKPSGTTFLHMSHRNGAEEGLHVLWQSGDRAVNKRLSAAAALRMVLDSLDAPG